MQENFRQFLDRLRQVGELVDLHQPVDIRHIATLVDQAKTALYFHNVIGYDMPVVSGIIRSRERAMMALGAETYREIEDKLSAAIAKPIPPKYVKTSPAREVTLLGDDVDLYKLPIPMSSIYDGGPMITAGVGPTKPDAGVMATSPATAPEQMPITVGLPFMIHSTTIQVKPAVAVAVWVTSMAMPACRPAVTADPALKPNQPTHSKEAPIMVSTTLWAGPVSVRLPSISAVIRPAVPELTCTTVPPAKSSTLR